MKAAKSGSAMIILPNLPIFLRLTQSVAGSAFPRRAWEREAKSRAVRSHAEHGNEGEGLSRSGVES
jgi:hypothetical protein